MKQFVINTLVGFFEWLHLSFFGCPFNPYFAAIPAKRVSHKYQQTLRAHFRFYNYLTHYEQAIFEARLERFMEEKKFKTMKGLELTDLMKNIETGLNKNLLIFIQ